MASGMKRPYKPGVRGATGPDAALRADVRALNIGFGNSLDDLSAARVCNRTQD